MRDGAQFRDLLVVHGTADGTMPDSALTAALQRLGKHDGLLGIRLHG
jgi:hypothetical protein